MELLFLDGRGEPLLLKQPHDASKPAPIGDRFREWELYAAGALDGLDAPECVAASPAGAGPEPWLVLDRIDGIPLWQADGLEPWQATARWLARLHATPAPAVARLLRHDRAYLRSVTATAAELAADVRAAVDRAITLVSADPPVFLHGELYPSNVIVQATPSGSRIRPIDWETAGTGPWALDLAALIAGNWPRRRRAAIVDAYARERGLEPNQLEPALDAARLLVAVQWLGWSWGADGPPPEHRHDWAADTDELAGRIR